MPFAEGFQLGAYEIVAPIGPGGMGANSTPTPIEVPYSVEGIVFQPGKPQVLFEGGFQMGNPYPSYDVAPDGKHFAMLVAATGNSSSSPQHPPS